MRITTLGTLDDIEGVYQICNYCFLFFDSGVEHANPGPRFVGSLVTIPCYGFKWKPEFRNTYLHWSICANCKGQWDLIASTIIFAADQWNICHYSNSFKGRVNISVPTGDLIILTTEKRDEGLYKCEFMDSTPNQHQLVLHGKFFYNL